MPLLLELALGLLAVGAATFVVVCAWTLIADDSPNKAAQLRVELDAARQQATIDATTIATMTQLAAMPGRPR